MLELLCERRKHCLLGRGGLWTFRELGQIRLYARLLRTEHVRRLSHEGLPIFMGRSLLCSISITLQFLGLCL